MSRDLNDPRIAEVIRVFKRFDETEDCSEQVTGEFVEAILHGGFHGENLHGLSKVGLRALLETYLQHTDDLDRVVAVARAQLAWLEHFEAECAGRNPGVFDYPTALREQQAAVSP